MDSVILLEVLDRRGHVRSRHRVNALPATVGRGYGSALILDDRYVDAEHFRVVREPGGELVAEDLNSVNGLYELGRHPVRASRIVLQPGTRIRVGQTTLRVCFPDQPVAPTAAEPAVGFVSRVFGESRLAVALLGVAALTAYAVNSWLGSHEHVTLFRLVIDSLFILLALSLWAGLWSFVARVLLHRLVFLPHLGLVSAAVLALLFAQTIISYFEFLVPSSSAEEVLRLVARIGILGALLYGHLALSTAISTRRRLLAALGVTVGVVGLFFLGSVADREEFHWGVDIRGSLKPVGAGLVRTVPVEAFFADAARLRADVDSLSVKRDGRER